MTRILQLRSAQPKLTPQFISGHILRPAAQGPRLQVVQAGAPRRQRLPPDQKGDRARLREGHLQRQRGGLVGRGQPDRRRGRGQRPGPGSAACGRRLGVAGGGARGAAVQRPGARPQPGPAHGAPVHLEVHQRGPRAQLQADQRQLVIEVGGWRCRKAKQRRVMMNVL